MGNTIRLNRPGLRRWQAVLLSLLLCPVVCASQDVVVENPYRIKAAFIRNFAHYVTWPDTAFSGSASPWCVAVLGPDPFGAVLDETLKGREEQGRAFKVVRAETPDDLLACHIVFVAYKDGAKRRAALDKLRGRPVLSVGDAPEFLREGGVVRFQVADRVRMSINLDQARSAELTIQTRMLEVSSDVLENGSIHHMR